MMEKLMNVLSFVADKAGLSPKLSPRLNTSSAGGSRIPDNSTDLSDHDSSIDVQLKQRAIGLRAGSRRNSSAGNGEPYVTEELASSTAKKPRLTLEKIDENSRGRRDNLLRPNSVENGAGDSADEQTTSQGSRGTPSTLAKEEEIDEISDDATLARSTSRQSNVSGLSRTSEARGNKKSKKPSMSAPVATTRTASHSSSSTASTKKDTLNVAVAETSDSALASTSTEGEDAMIRDVATRMLPKAGSASEKYLKQVKDFDLSRDLVKFSEKQEKLRSALKSGFRTKEQAMSEFKLLHHNLWVSGITESHRKKKKTKAKDDDNDGDVDLPCQCTKACGEDCLNRSLQIECNPQLCPVALQRSGVCHNQRIAQGKKKQTEVRASEQKGCGLFAVERISKGSYVNEYVGEVIDDAECARRLAQEYVDEKHKYLMCMNGGLLIDATRKGNVARFINHSCDPNCAVQEWRVKGQPRMGIFAIKDILPGVELCFNYNFQRFGEGAQMCHCGAETCAGWLGRTVEEKDSLQRKVRPGQDPVLNDHVGEMMDESASRKMESVVLSLLENVMPQGDRKKIRQEGLFLMRNVRRALDEVYVEGGSLGWKTITKEPSL